MGRPTLYFLRHGQTDWNVAYRLQGQMDIPINANGREQAARNGRRLASLIDEPERMAFIASPLGRTRETMEIARRELGLKTHGYETDDRLKELSFGLWQGFTFDELRGQQDPAVEARFADKWGFVPAGGESYAMLLERVKGWLPYQSRDAVVVTHGGVIRVLMHHLGGMPTDKAVRETVPQDRVFVWDADGVRWLD